MKKIFDLNVVLISHYQNCTGTVYLHSLLDGHPEICTIPGVPSLLPVILNKYNTPEEALSLFNNVNPKFYDTSKMTREDVNSTGLFCLGKGMNEGIQTDRQVFSNYYLSHMEGEKVTPRNIIISLYYAFIRVHKLDLSKLKVLLLHPHEPTVTFIFHEIFPDSKQLIIIRNPMRAYCSAVKIGKEKGQIRNQPFSPIGLLRGVGNNLYEYCKRDMNMCIFRIEDLESHKEYIFKSISKFIGVTYDDSMHSSSFCSKSFWGAKPSIRNNEFDASRHTKPVPLRKYEKKLFHVINKKLYSVTGYSDYNFNIADHLFSLLWLILPLNEELKWFKDAFIDRKYKGMKDTLGNNFSLYRDLIGYMKVRILLIFIFFRNFYTNHYDIIYKSLIRPSKTIQ